MRSIGNAVVVDGEAKSRSLASLGMTCSGDLWMSGKTVMDWGEGALTP